MNGRLSKFDVPVANDCTVEFLNSISLSSPIRPVQIVLLSMFGDIVFKMALQAHPVIANQSEHHCHYLDQVKIGR